MGYGEPKPVQGKCNARLHVGDNYGDNHTTMLCELEPHEGGVHQETWQSKVSGRVAITWEHEDPQIAIDEVQAEIERVVTDAVEDEHNLVHSDIEYLIEQDISAIKLYCGAVLLTHQAVHQAVYFLAESQSLIWVSIGSMGAGETLPKDQAIAKLIAGLKGH